AGALQPAPRPAAADRNDRQARWRHRLLHGGRGRGAVPPGAGGGGLQFRRPWQVCHGSSAGEGGMRMETMSPLDASFLHIEDAVTHMHIGSVGIFEGPPPGPGEVRDAIAARLPLVPRYRQKVRFVPFELGRPVWVDDPHFNLDYHVRRTALPA